MKSPSSSETVVASPPVTTRSAIGAQSRPLRFLIVTLVVALYMALGFVLHLAGPEYQLLGVVLLLVFQVGIHRQPLHTL